MANLNATACPGRTTATYAPSLSPSPAPLGLVSSNIAVSRPAASVMTSAIHAPSLTPSPALSRLGPSNAAASTSATLTTANQAPAPSPNPSPAPLRLAPSNAAASSPAAHLSSATHAPPPSAALIYTAYGWEDPAVYDRETQIDADSSPVSSPDLQPDRSRSSRPKRKDPE